VQPKVQLRAGESECVKPASAMKPQVTLRMPRASARWIWVIAELGGLHHRYECIEGS
jgi:hypothetical protein